ncbi:MAG: DoxX family protein [Dyadobacter sp.]|uniref:DoxX family protein n=1 Tax=Dyadobacter sp. TaxID=1914288 RepID=UPI001B1C8885|nr:DoxX family protein [Dyadobacter sp.]MBO9617249.1 DoxX family protein [Dyadobacter sp.]
MNTKKVKFIYWASTLFLGLVGLAGIANILMVEELVQVNRSLGLPDYFMPFFGFVKVVGAITILAPALRRFQQAAYFGFIFYFIGATYTLMATHGGPEKWGATLLILAAAGVSYWTWQQLFQSKFNSQISQ